LPLVRARSLTLTHSLSGCSSVCNINTRVHALRPCSSGLSRGGRDASVGGRVSPTGPHWAHTGIVDRGQITKGAGPAPSRGSTGSYRAGGHVPTRPAGLPHPWGTTSCRKAAQLVNDGMDVYLVVSGSLKRSPGGPTCTAGGGGGGGPGVRRGPSPQQPCTRTRFVCVAPRTGLESV